MGLAHDIDKIKRTADVYIHENIDFTGMLLSDQVLAGITSAGFRIPSPIQLKSIPLGLCGFDLIVQAKSGTGKTVVFSIVALETVLKDPKFGPQVLILTPTREIAVQIQEVLNTIGSKIEGFRTEYFIGGVPEAQDIETLSKNKINVAIGAPGRIKSLIEKGVLRTKSIKVLILDEADKLMLNSFKPDIDFINSRLPTSKQVIATSATYSDKLEIENLMQNPTTINAESDIPTLLGVRQFISIIPSHSNLLRQLKYQTDEFLRIISNVPFKQLIVFTNYQNRAESLSNNLCRLGWPAVFMSGSQTQTERLEALGQFRKQKYRILVSTDVTARGIDVQDVNFVVNFDVPRDGATYLHRIGRAGRYGSQGLCITICSKGDALSEFKGLLSNISTEFAINILPMGAVTQNLWKDSFERMVVSGDKITTNGVILKNPITNGDLVADPIITTNIKLSDSNQNHVNTTLATIIKTENESTPSEEIDEKTVNGTEHLEEIPTDSTQIEDETKVSETENYANPTKIEKIVADSTQIEDETTIYETENHANPTKVEENVADLTQIEDETTIYGTIMKPDLTTTPQALEEKYKQDLILKHNTSLLTIANLITSSKTKEVRSLEEIQQVLASRKTIISFSSLLSAVEQQIEKPLVIKFTSPRVTKIRDETLTAIEYCLECEREARQRAKETKFKSKNRVKSMEAKSEKLPETDSGSEVEVIQSRVVLDPINFDRQNYKILEKSKFKKRNLSRNIKLAENLKTSSEETVPERIEKVVKIPQIKSKTNEFPSRREYRPSPLYGNWYSMWREQLTHIQTHVNMAKLY